MSDGGRPSKESLREVKREYKARRKAERQRSKDAAAYWATQTGRKPKRRGGAVAAVVGLTAVAVAVAGGAAVAKVGPFAASGPTTAAAPTSASSSPAAPTTATPSSPAPSPSASDDPSLALPFAGTPAASWKPGATGLVAPTASQIGIYRTVQVKAAYAMTVRYLSKALLDPGVNFSGEMNQVLRTLGPGFPSYAERQHALWVKTKGAKGFGWVDLANRFHPGDWKAATQTRARGHFGKPTITGGSLRVPFVFITAYWVRPAKGGAARAIAIRRSGYLQFEGNGPRNVWLQQWFMHYTSSASLCGSTWPYPDYVQAWADLDAAPPGSLASPKPAYDLSDPDAPDPTGCFTDTSGFR